MFLKFLKPCFLTEKIEFLLKNAVCKIDCFKNIFRVNYKFIFV